MKNLTKDTANFKFDRLSKDLQKSLLTIYNPDNYIGNSLEENAVYQGPIP